MSNKQRWHLSYVVKACPEGLTRAQVPAEAGAADAVLLISIVLPPTGEYSQMTVSLDGRTGEPLSAVEEFKAWIMLAGGLKDNVTLDPGRRAFAEDVFNAFWDAIRVEH